MYRWYVAEEASGLADDEILRRAADERAVLLTCDKDVGDLVFRQGRAMGGVVLLRVSSASPEPGGPWVDRAAS